MDKVFWIEEGEREVGKRPEKRLCSTNFPVDTSVFWIEPLKQDIRRSEQGGLMWQPVAIGVPQKVYGHREGRGEKREEKRSHFKAIIGSYGPFPNEVLKGCFGTTSKTIGSYPVSSCKSWIQVGKVERFLDPCFLPRSSLRTV